jgi:hypothetical protein
MPEQQGQGLPNIGSVSQAKDRSDKRTQGSLGSAQEIARDDDQTGPTPLGEAGNSQPVVGRVSSHGRQV